MDDNDDLVRGIGRLEGKMDSLIDMVKQHVQDDKVLEKRIGALERWRAYVIGLGAAAGAGGAKVASLFPGVL